MPNFISLNALGVKRFHDTTDPNPVNNLSITSSYANQTRTKIHESVILDGVTVRKIRTALRTNVNSPITGLITTPRWKK